MAGSRLTVSGQANLAGTRALDLAAGGALDLRVLSAFLPDIATGGVGDLALTVQGTASAPALNGTVRLRGAELRLREPAVSLSNVNGLVALRPETIDVTGLEGELNGGRVAIIGGLSYEGLAVTNGSLSLQATGVALDMPRGLRTEIDGSLALTLGTRLLLSGQVDIVRGAYREPLSLAVELASATRTRAAAPAARPSILDRLDLNVRLASRDPLIVDNNYGRMDLAVDVRLVGTASAPSIVGRATIAEGGVLYLGGRSYLVDRGVIDFSNPRAIVPDLDLLARARIRGTDESNTLRDYDVTVAITGTPDTVKATLSSDPSRSQADIVSLLATGRLADQVGGAGAAVAREQVLGYLSGDALAFAAQAIGVDSIRFERDPGIDALASDPSLAGGGQPGAAPHVLAAPDEPGEPHAVAEPRGHGAAHLDRRLRAAAVDRGADDLARRPQPVLPGAARRVAWRAARARPRVRRRRAPIRVADDPGLRRPAIRRTRRPSRRSTCRRARASTTTAGRRIAIACAASTWTAATAKPGCRHGASRTSPTTPP